MTTKSAILQAVRAKCLDCSGGQLSFVRDCHLAGCALWPFRQGRDPEPSRGRGFGALRQAAGNPAAGNPAAGIQAAGISTAGIPVAGISAADVLAKDDPATGGIAAARADAGGPDAAIRSDAAIRPEAAIRAEAAMPAASRADTAAPPVSIA